MIISQPVVENCPFRLFLPAARCAAIVADDSRLIQLYQQGSQVTDAHFLMLQGPQYFKPADITKGLECLAEIFSGFSSSRVTLARLVHLIFMNNPAIAYIFYLFH